MHYRDLPGMVSLAETWMATGKIKGAVRGVQCALHNRPTGIF